MAGAKRRRVCELASRALRPHAADTQTSCCGFDERAAPKDNCHCDKPEQKPETTSEHWVHCPFNRILPTGTPAMVTPVL
jgi:hypothetical protein